MDVAIDGEVFLQVFIIHGSRDKQVNCIPALVPLVAQEA
jgi:hypothetical protein